MLGWASLSFKKTAWNFTSSIMSFSIFYLKWKKIDVKVGDLTSICVPTFIVVCSPLLCSDFSEKVENTENTENKMTHS